MKNKKKIGGKKKVVEVHEHKFKRAGMTLYCVCGFTQRIECAHKWEQEKYENVSFEKLGGSVHQNQYTHICKICGSVRHTNTTSGVTTIHH